MTHSILVLNGPNLNLLGTREPEVYGDETLDEMLAALRAQASEHSITIDTFQSNSEGELIDRLHQAVGESDGVIFNPGALAHYSYALRDAILATDLQVVEAHMTNVYARDQFRHTSVLAGVCLGVVAGFGRDSYFLAFEALRRHID